MKKTFILKNNRTGKEIPEFLTKVDVIMTDSMLTFKFECKNSKFYSAYDQYNKPIWEGDVCEAYVCTGGDIHHYYEIEVAPNGTIFLEKIYNPMDERGQDGVEEFPVPINENFITAKVEKINDSDYNLEFSMPLDKIGYDKEKGLLFNAFRIETEGGYTDKNLLSLSPTLLNGFHYPQFFVELK